MADDSKSLVISLTDVQNDIYIHNPKDLKNSLFEDLYRHVYKRVHGIILQNERYQETLTGWDNYYTSLGNNIIPFISGRGTGKTSSMMTTMKFLEAKTGLQQFADPEDHFNEYNFYCIHRLIRADMLEEGERILEAVLVEMYSQMESEADKRFGTDREYQRRQLLSRFDKIYRDYCAVKDGTSAEGPSLQKLHMVSMSSQLRENFSSLVSDYLAYMKKDNGDSRKSYLVIAIDDLDMNIEHGFELMEQIHRYLMIPNLIVLMALDMGQFTDLCKKHYEKIKVEDFSSIVNNNWADYWNGRINTITQNYIDKIFPAENRVYLPGLKNENRKISLKRADSEMDEPKPVKWIILNMLYHRTAVLCDGLGVKKHYYEPDTLRKLVSFYLYLNMQKSYQKYLELKDSDSKNKVEIKQQLDQVLNNLELIYKDIAERMEIEKLDEQQKLIFDEIRHAHETRQFSDSFNKLCELLYREGMADNFEPKADPQGIGIRLERYKKYGEPYSYGDYMLALYEYSTYSQKALVHLLLALQTANLTGLYVRILQKKEMVNLEENPEKQVEFREELDEDMKDFRRILGNSITGEWYKYICERICPQYSIDTRSSRHDRLVSSIRLPRTLIADNPDPVWNAMFMLIPNADIFKIGKTQEDDQVEIVFSSKVTVDPLGFVLESFDSKGHRERMNKALQIYYEPGSSPVWKEDEKEAEKIECCLPVYSVDVYYNLLKRVYANKPSIFREYQDIDIDLIRSDDELRTRYAAADWEQTVSALDTYVSFLRRIDYLLKLQDNYYTDDGKEEACRIDLQRKFRENSFVKLFELFLDPMEPQAEQSAESRRTVSARVRDNLKKLTGDEEIEVKTVLRILTNAYVFSVKDNNNGSTEENKGADSGAKGSTSNGKNVAAGKADAGDTGKADAGAAGKADAGDTGDTGKANVGDTGDTGTADVGDTGKANAGDTGDIGTANAGGTGDTGKANAGDTGTADAGGTGDTGTADAGGTGKADAGDTGDTGKADVGDTGTADAGDTGDTGKADVGGTGKANAGGTGDTGKAYVGASGKAYVGASGTENVGSAHNNNSNGNTVINIAQSEDEKLRELAAQREPRLPLISPEGTDENE